MVSKVLFVVILAAAVSGTASWAIDPPRADEPPRGVVLTSDEAMEVYMECWIPAEEPHSEAFKGWVPSPAEIAHFEALLPGFLHSQKTPSDFQPLHEYYRRYAGVIKNGKKTICINFFHYTGITGSIGEKTFNTPEDFLRGGVTVCDGGGYYFTVQFDVESESFWVAFNGYA